MLTAGKRIPTVVLDTNVLLSHLWGSSNCSRILSAILVENRCKVATSPMLMAEFDQVVSRQKFKRHFGDLVIASFRREYQIFARTVTPRSQVAICSDPDDNRVLECAQEAGADYIVTGDEALLKIGCFENARIVDPTTFVRLLSEQ